MRNNFENVIETEISKIKWLFKKRKLVFMLDLPLILYIAKSIDGIPYPPSCAKILAKLIHNRASNLVHKACSRIVHNGAHVTKILQWNFILTAILLIFQKFLAQYYSNEVDRRWGPPHAAVVNSPFYDAADHLEI